MSYKEFDRFAIKMESLAVRASKKYIVEDHIDPGAQPGPLDAGAQEIIGETVERVRAARAQSRPVIVAFGAHAIKNGLGPVFLRLLEGGWITHLATNGAGIIHDWEFSYQGRSCEDVGPLVKEGRFGNWEETGFYINLALNVGAYEGRGYGESVGALIQEEGLRIPDAAELEEAARRHLASAADRAAAAADLLFTVRRFQLEAGRLSVPHPFKSYSVQAGALRLGVPFTGHPMIGQDIIYNHPMNRCACVGRTAERDFLVYADAVSRIEGGVYLSIGSAIMSPMIFEKSLSMSRNVAAQRGERIENHYILVNDLAASSWDWRRGEPPEDEPAYYLRYNKSFSRMGGTLRYLQADNRDFLLSLNSLLERCEPA